VHFTPFDKITPAQLSKTLAPERRKRAMIPFKKEITIFRPKRPDAKVLILAKATFKSRKIRTRFPDQREGYRRVWNRGRVGLDQLLQHSRLTITEALTVSA
jgi:hypothetical protein